MIVNGTAECFIRIMYDGEAAIQKIELKDYNKILDRFPKGTRIKILCFKDNSYKWIDIKSVLIEKRSLYNVYKDGIFGFEVLCKDGFVPDVPIIPRKIWDVNRVTFSSVIMGLLCIDKYVNYKVKWIDENNKECGYSLKSFLANRKKLTKYDTALYSKNDIEFDVKTFVNDMSFILTEGIDPFKIWYPEMTYFMSLIFDWVLTPAILNKTTNINFDSKWHTYYVPLSLYPSIYLLYGGKGYMSSCRFNRCPANILNFSELKFSKCKSQRICSNLKLVLEDESYRPVIMANNFPVRWLNE